MRVILEDRSLRVPRRELNLLQKLIEKGENERLSVNLLVVGDAASKRLNQKFLNHDYATDVIAFDLRGDGEGLDDVDGEIIVNAALAVREGKARGHGPKAEFLFYVAHGLLHLIGYDDATPKLRAAMHRKQAQYLAALGLTVRS